MSDRPLKLLLIDPDPIFRLGLRVALEAVPDAQVVSEVEKDTAALQILAELAQNDPSLINLVVLELGNGRSTSSQQLSLQLCQHLKSLYPNLPILLLSSTQELELLWSAKSAGVNGYCPKGTPVSELVAAMQEVAYGGSYWNTEQEDRSPNGHGEGFPTQATALLSEGVLVRVGEASGQGEASRSRSVSVRRREEYPKGDTGNISDNFSALFQLPFTVLRNKLSASGIGYINATLAAVTTQLQVPGLPLIERAVLAGQRRELLAARWFVNQLLSPSQKQQLDTHSGKFPQRNYSTPDWLQLPSNSSVSRSISADSRTQNSPLLSPRALQSAIFASCITKLQFPLQNLTDVALEIDILRVSKKRELLYLILQKVADLLDEMRNSQVELNQLYDFKETLLLDLWREATRDFFGKFSRIRVDDRHLEIVNLLLQDTKIVQTEILSKIPLVLELFAYFLFQTDLQIDNTSYASSSFEAKEQAEIILENLLIQIANGVIQPLLNSFADVEVIKQSFYDSQLISTREIEKFRNNLSWRYRLSNYIAEPKAIFESRYELFVFAPRGIATISIYAPRKQELAQLSGPALFVTLVLEFRDAITPRLQSLLSFFGRVVVFVLTRIIGRSIGLIARGIIQGIGSVSLPIKKE